MIIRLKNKDTLNFDDFSIKCVIGKNGLNKNKKEGDKSTQLETLNLALFTGEQIRLKNPKQIFLVKKLTKIWVGVMILIADFTIKKSR